MSKVGAGSELELYSYSLNSYEKSQSSRVSQANSNSVVSNDSGLLLSTHDTFNDNDFALHGDTDGQRKRSHTYQGWVFRMEPSSTASPPTPHANTSPMAVRGPSTYDSKGYQMFCGGGGEPQFDLDLKDHRGGEMHRVLSDDCGFHEDHGNFIEEDDEVNCFKDGGFFDACGLSNSQNSQKRTMDSDSNVESVSLLNPPNTCTSSTQLLDLNKAHETTQPPKYCLDSTVPTATTQPKSNLKRDISWSYRAPSSITPWSVSSLNMLTITYRRVDEAVPAYTNISRTNDYLSRILLGTPIHNSYDREHRTSSMKMSFCSSLGPRNVTIYKETYTRNDILRITPLDEGIYIRGWRGKCRAIQVHLKPPQSLLDSSGRRFRPFQNLQGSNDIRDEVEQQWNRGTMSQHPPDDEQVLKRNGLVEVEGDVGLPTPPWCLEKTASHLNKESKDENFEELEKYSPIITFAVPIISPEMNMGQNDMNMDDFCFKLLEDSPPLLWKVQLPPDPSIAIEALTVFDGFLDIQGGVFSSFFRKPSKILTEPTYPSEHGTDEDDIASSSSSSSSSVSSSSTSSSTVTWKRKIERPVLPTHIYINGYQSWSFAGSVQQGQPQPMSAMPDYLSKAFNLGGVVPPRHLFCYDRASGWMQDRSNPTSTGVSKHPDAFSSALETDGYYHSIAYYKSDFYTCISASNDSQLDEDGGPALVMGWISQHKQYGIITSDKKLRRLAMHCSLSGVIPCRKEGISTDWAYCQSLPSYCYDEEPLSYYLQFVASFSNARPFQLSPPLTGWCSWYHYYENIDAGTLRLNFRRLASLKKKITSDVAIVDDGWMNSWGDWSSLKDREFPVRHGGMKIVAESIKSNGMKAGLWMAPFACDKNSMIAKMHPDWLIKNDEGRIANSSNCGKFFYGLDATNPAVRKYAFECVRRAVKDWGYELLKLDFLYAACLAGNGKYDMSLTRAETMHLALQTMRAAAGPDTFLIGCGCPLGPAIGYIDAMRISADTAGSWYPSFPLPWWDNGTLPSVRGMVRNSITRACIGHRWWHNDPDCILLGETTTLTENEVISAATIVAMTGGMLLLSDDLNLLGLARLRIGTRVFPVTGVTAVVLDLLSTKNGDGAMPSLLRLWLSDAVEDSQHQSMHSSIARNALRTSFSPEKAWSNPVKRERNCIPVTTGLGSWACVSVSNWSDTPKVVSVPITALLLKGRASTMADAKDLDLNGNDQIQANGYHVFSFWSSKYLWVSNDQIRKGRTLSKKLGSHESEIFHVKKVSVDLPQYIGSDLHFTCGCEISSFVFVDKRLVVQLNNEFRRAGFIYVYIPTSQPSVQRVKVNDDDGRVDCITRVPCILPNRNNGSFAGLVLRIWVVIHAKGTVPDGRVEIII